MNGPSKYWLALLGAAILPIVASAILALTPIGAEAMVPLLIAGGVGSAGVALVAFLISRKLSKITAVCERLGGAGPAADEFECIAQTLISLDARHKESDEAFAKSLKGIAATVAKIGDGSVPGELETLPGDSDAVKAVASALRDTTKKVSVLRQRQATSAKILHEIATPILAVDDAGQVRFANAAIERLLNKPGLAKREFPTLVATPDEPIDAFGRKILDGAEFQNWLKQGGRGEAIVEFAVDQEPRTRLSFRGLRLANSVEGVWYLAGRDLSDEYRRASMDRAETREQALRAIWDSTSRASTESIETILAATRLLTSDAKQATDRETMLTRATALRQHAGGLESYLRTIRWLNLALWGELPQPLTSEFQAHEPVKAAIEQLMPRFKGRNITVSITDEGGWVVADEEWLRTALVGILFHAAESVSDASVGVHVNRVPPLPNATEERVAFEVVDAGPVLTSAQMGDLESPFGGLVTPSFLAPDAVGYMPGLILAADLARRMNGTLEFDATPGGGLVVRFVLPTRVVTGTLAEPAAEPSESIVFEELVIGWKLGVA